MVHVESNACWKVVSLCLSSPLYCHNTVQGALLLLQSPVDDHDGMAATHTGALHTSATMAMTPHTRTRLHPSHGAGTGECVCVGVCEGLRG